MNLKPLITLTLSVFLISSCTKKTSSTAPVVPPPTTSDSFSAPFVNWTDTTVNIDIYTTLNDYINQTNKLYSIRLVATPIYKMLKKNTTYYLDYYSDSYIYSNWDFWDYAGQDAQPVPTCYNLGFTVLTNNFMGDARYIYINKNQEHTNWKVTDAFKYNSTTSSWVSVWSSLSTTKKNMTVTFHRNFKMNFVDTAGIAQTYLYEPGETTDFQYGTFVKMADTLSVGSLENASINHVPPYTHSYDTLGLFYNSDNTHYIFVKQ